MVMKLKSGDKLPASYTFQYLDKEPATLSTTDMLKGKFVIVGVPAAFSPPCSESHLPGFIDQVDTFAKKGYKIIVVSVDNLFSLKAWAKSFGVDGKSDKILFVSDLGGSFVKNTGLSTTEVPPLGEVSSRFALVVEDGDVKYVGQEKSVGEFTVSTADAVLKQI